MNDRLGKSGGKYCDMLMIPFRRLFCMRSRLLDHQNYNDKLFHVERVTIDWLVAP